MAEDPRIPYYASNAIIMADQPEERGVSIWAVVGAIALIALGAWFVLQKRDGGSTISVDDLPPPPPMCLTAVTGTTTVYSRPSAEAAVFGEIAPVEIVQLAGKTEDGWLGFEPGTAQAPNVGLLRLRWIPPETPNDLSPGCIEVPTVPTLSADACYVMTHGTATVLTEASASGSVLETFSEDFREATGRVEVAGATYFRVESLAGVESSTVGYVNADEVDQNGPCDFPAS